MANAPDPRKLAAEKRAEVARWQRWVITVNDQPPVVFRLGDLTASLVRELRQQTGMNIPEMLVQAEFQPGSMWDIDSTAALIWMGRRQAGDAVTFADVADDLRLDQVINICHEDDPEPVEAYPDPPDSGGS